MTREEAIEEVKNYDNYPHGLSKECRDYIIKILKQEQKTGHWIEHPHEAGANWEFPRYECSECHNWAEDDSDYCPNCGAFCGGDNNG